MPVARPEKIIGLDNVVRGAFCSAFLGDKPDADYLSRGYMTAAAGMLVRYAFRESGLHRIEANVMPRVLEKNGFVNEGLSRDCLKINGVWEDRIHMMKISRAMRGR
ncbi:MAG: GNAT family N-acetyltransferase [Acutalibacteraceae bacterium]